MRWKGTVNNYQGIICYWVGEQLPPSPSLWLWALGSTYKQAVSHLREVWELLFISLVTSCTWASLSHRARQAETWKEPTKNYQRVLNFIQKKLLLLGSTCWSLSEQIHCLSRTFVRREGSLSLQCYSHTLGLHYNIPHGASYFSHQNIFLLKLKYPPPLSSIHYPPMSSK